MGKETILPETPLLSITKLVQHAIQSLKSDDKETTLSLLEVALSVLTKFDPYLDQYSAEGPSSLEPLIQETIHHDWKKAYAEKKVSYEVGPHWSAGAYEGGFVAMVAQTLKAKRVLEVGMFTGTTTLCIANVLPSDGKVVSLELDQYFKDLATPYFEKAGLNERIDVRVGSAKDALEKMKESQEAPFDLIFIDADKAGYLAYYEAIMESGLLRKGGVMLIDNVLYKGYPFTPELQKDSKAKLPDLEIDASNGEALIKFNSHVSKDPRVQVIILPIRDGVSWIMAK
ncbi:hypothetical protein CBS101457_001806 [Exobasidium rhododendri]|nr:hypothetical protein CBS101457_001806 [Exobasidium rhododendri]